MEEGYYLKHKIQNIKKIIKKVSIKQNLKLK